MIKRTRREWTEQQLIEHERVMEQFDLELRKQYVRPPTRTPEEALDAIHNTLMLLRNDYPECVNVLIDVAIEYVAMNWTGPTRPKPEVPND